MELYIEGFLWMDWVVEKIMMKHNVRPDEVEEAFYNPPYKVQRVEGGKLRFVGRSNAGRYLSVVFVWVDHHVKVITARDMDAAERRFYSRK